MGYGCYAHSLAYRWSLPQGRDWTHPVAATNIEHICHRLPRELEKMPAGSRILLSSMTDPYQKIEEELLLTRTALRILLPQDNKDTGKKIIILTKSPLVLRDIELLEGRCDVEVGFTIICNWEAAQAYEPGAPSPQERMDALIKLHDKGIRTFVSIEPWLPGITQPLNLIPMVRPYADKIILGSLNHVATELDDYRNTLLAVEDLCKKLGIDLYVKKELRKAMKVKHI